MTSYENEKIDLMKKNQILLNQFQLLQKQKADIAKRIASVKYELFVLDGELKNAQKSISELEAKKELLL